MPFQPRDPVERFWERVEKTESCWLWHGRLHKGYGHIVVVGVAQPAHRFAYELLVGPIPAGLQLDHLCRVRHCVNPTHLEPVTCKENLNRGIHRNAIKTHCSKGHEFTPENTGYYPHKDGRRRRQCRECNRQNCARYYEARKAS